MFSGGRDSLLSVCRLIEEGKQVSLITFNNGCMYGSENVKMTAERLVERYGKAKVQFLGICNTIGVWRSFFLPFLNLKPSEIIEKYGEVTASQFHCLTCKASMYVYAIVICKSFHFQGISDGARHSQGFAIELEPLIGRWKQFVNDYNLELTLPVFDLKSDWERKNELLLHGVLPKVLEPQCLLGVPLPKGDQLEESVVNGVCKLFHLEILPKCKELVHSLEAKQIQFNQYGNRFEQ